MSLPESTEKIVPVRIEEEVKTSFLDYAMSVIVSRALPDVRDGLKPVQRRILYTMYDLDIVSGKPHKKSARIVGDVLGKYHPHGDMSVYDAMVRMAQNFSYRYPLVDGHGNFGSVDGDSPAAMRYTEVRLAKIAEELLLDIEKETVDFAPNYDESLQEPKVLPAKIPQLLMNGASGIAVGMATNIPPHNLRELIDGLCYVIDNPECNIDDLMQFIKGPDFPTFGYIRGSEGIRDAYTTGRGSIVLRGKYEKEETQGGKKRIIITQLPYQVNKANLVTKIAELARDKKIIGISDIRDESDRQGMSIVIELKKDTDADRILKYLCKHTQLQTTFNVLMLALVDSKPQVLNLKQMLEGYVNHRREVVRRRTVFELNKAQERAHILEGLKIALDHLDEIISLIRASKDVDSARQGLIKKFSLSEKQAQAILDLRLQRLTGLERKKLDDEYKELIKKIAYYQDLLADEKRIYGVIKEELLQIKETYGDARKTIIWSQSGEINFEEIIPDLEVIVTLTKDGYIKRVPATTYKIQRRGGRGITGTTTKEEDIVDEIVFSNTLHHLLFFSQKGIVYRLRTFDIPEFGRQAKGTALVNLIQIQSGENISACISTSDVKEEGYLFMTTKQGTVKKTSLIEFVNIQKNGKIALTLDKGDELGWVQKTDGNNEIILASKKGQSIRFNEKDVRFMGRTAKGVRGMRLKTGDEVRGMVAVPQDKKDKYDLLVVTTTGHGKRTKLINFRAQNRGGSGVRVIKLAKANAEIIGITIATPKDELVLISSSGIIIKMEVRGISTQGRQSQGVRLMRMDKDDAVVALEVIEEEEEG